MFSSLTKEEKFRLTGTLPPHDIESLLDIAAKSDGCPDFRVKLNEAQSQFPDEDFLSEPLKLLREVMKNSRGSNKEKLLRLFEGLSTIETEVRQAAEYGMSEIDDAIRMIHGQEQE